MIVAGSAACLHADLASTWADLGETWADAPVIAVNGASREVKAFALYSHHADRLASHGWIRNQKRLFGDDFTIHAREKDAPLEHVDFFWNIPGGGSSAWEARKLASFMGFDAVILCGCPLDPGLYVGNHNLGGLMTDKKVLDDLRQYMLDDTEWHEGVVSASGWTRDVLGGLDARISQNSDGL